MTTYKYNGKNFEIGTTAYTLSIMGAYAFVKAVEDIVFADGHYMEFFRGLAVRYITVAMYAPGTEWPYEMTGDDGELNWDLVELVLDNSDLYETIVESIDKGQYMKILETLNDDIDYRTGNRYHETERQLVRLINKATDFAHQHKDEIIALLDLVATTVTPDEEQ